MLKKKIKQVKQLLKSCTLCERRCKVNRIKGERGFCQAGLNWRIFGMHPHLGEEPELIPSGTIFAAGCTMRCCYCQNAPESIQPQLGTKMTPEQVAGWIEQAPIQNINFVGGDPTSYLYNILQTLQICKRKLPVIWNSNAYYSKQTADILKGIIDIYLLDFRYFNEDCAVRLSNAPNYPKTAKRNLLTASKDADLIVRLLILPNHIQCCAKPILKWLRKNLGPDTRINIMDQYKKNVSSSVQQNFQFYSYRPAYQAKEELNRYLIKEEFQDVVNYAKKLRLKNLVQNKRI
jgi:putative pyruvate formate lyase activating enzyme